MGERPVASHSALAAADLSTSQYLAVKVDTNGKWALATAADDAVAILQEKTASGAAGNGMYLGCSLAVFGGTITAGDKLAVNASSQVVLALPGDVVIGRALESGVANDKKTVLLTGSHRKGSSGKVIPFVFDLADISAATMISLFLPGFRGVIKKLSATVLKAATTGAKAATLTPRVNATTPTGGSLALTSANMTPIGAVVDSTAVTAGGDFGPTDTLSLVAAGVTAFAEGRASIAIHVE
jgi:hypothetical protein